MYWENRLCWLLRPNATASALYACGLTGPRNLAIIARAGFPGISRGRKKLSVSAAHRVSAKKPRRRSANLMPCSRCSFSHPYVHPLARCAEGHEPLVRARPAQDQPPLCWWGTDRPGGPDPTRSLLRGLEVHHLLAPVRVVVRGWLRVWVGLGDPAAEGARVVLEPVDRLGDRDDGHLLQHDLLQLGHDRVLLAGVGGGGVGVDQRVRGLVAVPFS